MTGASIQSPIDTALLTTQLTRELSQVGVAILDAYSRYCALLETPSYLSYVSGRLQLTGIAVRLNKAIHQLEGFYVDTDQALRALWDNQQEPSDALSAIDLESLYAELVLSGLVSDSTAAKNAIESLLVGGISQALVSYSSHADELASQIFMVRDLVVAKRDRKGGYQGGLAEIVALNEYPWRQAFALMITRFNGLFTELQTGALVVAEAATLTAGGQSLLSNVSDVQVVQAIMARRVA